MRRKLSWFDHVCQHETLPKITQQVALIVVEEDCSNHGRPTHVFILAPQLHYDLSLTAFELFS